MAADIFTALSNLRMILDTETDADSPNSETLNKAYRYAIECLLMLLAGTGDSGSATSDPPDDSTGVLTDSGAAYSTDEHNGRTLVMTSGAAKGNTYTIDDTTATTLVCTGDNLYSDGVRSGDDYLVLYDIKTNADGHDHDGINSPIPILGAASIANSKLKTSGGSATGSGAVNVTMQDWSFSPNIYQAIATALYSQQTTLSADYIGRFRLADGGNYAVYYRYLTASDEPFMYVIRDKLTGKVCHCWMAEDPPPGFWGLSQTPKNFKPPLVPLDAAGRPSFDRDRHEEIILWRIKRDSYASILDRGKAEQKLTCEVLDEDFDYDQDKKIWKSKNLIEV